MAPFVYLDLNIFDKIEKVGRLNDSEKNIYSELKRLILENKIIVPYSNAHINDLYRGFIKKEDFIKGHLNNLKKLTNDLCICQYWNQVSATWHYRDVFDFFEEKKTDWDSEPETFDELLELTKFPSLLDLSKFIPLDEKWKLIYSQDPIFGIMYPKSKIKNTAYSLMEDIYEFQLRLKSDYSLYRHLKSYLIKSISKLKNNKDYINSIRHNFQNLPKHLDFFEIADLYAPKNDSIKNKNYSKILDVFYRHDLKGYKSDSNFNNMFDDGLHTFYAAHCDFFVTNDDRCKYKAEKTYEKLNIQTKVLLAEEYQEIIKLCKK